MWLARHNISSVIAAGRFAVAHDLSQRRERATAFYDAVLAPLRIQRIPSRYEKWAAWQRPGEAPKLWVGFPYNRIPATWGNLGKVVLAQTTFGLLSLAGLPIDGAKAGAKRRASR
jgi:hypothetical protein